MSSTHRPGRDARCVTTWTAALDAGGRCELCGAVLDPISAAINTPRRLLDPIVPARAGS